MNTILQTKTNAKGRKENPIELIEAQVLNGQIIILKDITEKNNFSRKARIRAFYMALKK